METIRKVYNWCLFWAVWSFRVRDFGFRALRFEAHGLSPGSFGIQDVEFRISRVYWDNTYSLHCSSFFWLTKISIIGS